MNLTIKRILHENVVPIICDDRTGTAFFISDAILITARHNIIGHLENERIPIVAIVDGQSFSCIGEPLGNPGERIDIAILRMLGKSDKPREGLKLLAAKLSEGMELNMLGYPNELGGSIDPIFLPLSFFGTGHHSDADLILLKKSEVSFFSYAGFSGSPVVNSCGSVVGITIIEESHNLRAISIAKIRVALGVKGIQYSTNALMEDDSPAGLLRCKSFLDKAIRKAGRKYSPDLHVPQKEFEEEFARFMDFDILEECEGLRSSIRDWCTRFPQFGGISIIGDREVEQNRFNYIEEISYNLWDKRDILDKQEREELERIRGIYFVFKEKTRIRHQSEKKLFGLYGPAGTGKSHICHSLAERYLSKGHHVYICHGIDISSDKIPDENIKSIFNLEDDTLIQINELAKNAKNMSYS